MSWNWNTEEETKDYGVKGTVTISTEEYRDLIIKVQELKAAGQREHDDWYEEYNENSKLKNEIKSRDELIAKYREYTNSSEIRKNDYLSWCDEKRMKRLAAEEED